VNRYSLLLMGVLILLALFFDTSEVQALDNDNPEITASLPNVRVESSARHPATNMVEASKRIEILLEEGEWCLVEFPNGKNGWVHGDYVEENGTRPLLALAKSYSARVDAINMTLRTGPGKEYPAFDQLPAGAATKVLVKEDKWLLDKLDANSTNYVTDSKTVLSQVASPEEQSLEGKTIAVDPGHGGSDPGAVGVTGLQEKDVALKTSEILAKHLKKHGASSFLTRTSDYFVPLQQRVNLAHSHGADIFVSVHANAHPNRNISGTETYYFRWGGHAQSSRNLGQEVQREMVEHSGLRDIGVKHGNFHVISSPQMPSILVELGFLTNINDEELLRQKDFLDGQARAITRGILNYYQDRN